MATPAPLTSEPVLAGLGALLPELKSIYTDIHSHPELSMQETRTAGIAADRLRKAGFDVTTGIGTTGVVGVLKNGDGPTVMLRADMDALPIKEANAFPVGAVRTGATSDEVELQMADVAAGFARQILSEQGALALAKSFRVRGVFRLSAAEKLDTESRFHRRLIERAG